ncbi:hypothetical protein [Caballeronia sp. dw_19]|uniref:hypothetical protein n=1 Tax=Caballeronia sp. dw_19 TaxID=2719791 RepID=UPI001BD34834|nr:hypothetical protein [Caballeronia sp. dw_19]
MKNLLSPSENWGTVALLSGPVAIAATLLYGNPERFVWIVAVTIVLVSSLLELSRRMGIRRLRKRVEAADNSTWIIYVNDVRAGTIKDSDYARAKLDAWLSPGNYLSQASNYLRVALLTIGRVGIIVPLVFVWLLALSAYLDPDSVAHLAAQMTNTNAKTIEAFAQLWTSISMLTLIIVTVVLPFFGISLGHVDHFVRDTHRRIRHLINTSADGRVEVEREATPSEASSATLS